LGLGFRKNKISFLGWVWGFVLFVGFVVQIYVLAMTSFSLNKQETVLSFVETEREKGFSPAYNQKF